MTHQITYQPDSTRTDTYAVYVDDGSAYKSWLDGDSTIPLANFVGRFEVYHSSTGAQGQWAVASKSQLENDLGTKKEDEAIEIVLKKGTSKTGKGIGASKEGAHKDDTKSGGFQVSKGAMQGGHSGGR